MKLRDTVGIMLLLFIFAIGNIFYFGLFDSNISFLYNMGYFFMICTIFLLIITYLKDKISSRVMVMVFIVLSLLSSISITSFASILKEYDTFRTIATNIDETDLQNNIDGLSTVENDMQRLSDKIDENNLLIKKIIAESKVKQAVTTTSEIPTTEVTTSEEVTTTAVPVTFNDDNWEEEDD
jgi:hypothetical protein